MKKLSVILAVLLAAVLLLASCGGDKPVDTEKSTEANANETAEPADTTAAIADDTTAEQVKETEPAEEVKVDVLFATWKSTANANVTATFSETKLVEKDGEEVSRDIKISKTEVDANGNLVVTFTVGDSTTNWTATVYKAHEGSAAYGYLEVVSPKTTYTYTK